MRVVGLLFLSLISPAFGGITDELPCKTPIQNLISRWQSTEEWDQLPSDKGKVFQTPTRNVGKWIRLEVRERAPIGVILTETGKREAHYFDSVTCRGSSERITTKFRSPAWKAEFTDAHLRTILSRHSRGIIYAWSPHMPLSFEGIKEVRLAAKKLGLPVFFALDPHADGDIARKLAPKFALSPEALRRVESLELFNRGVLDHFPAVVVFSRKRMQGKLIPGFKKSKDYVTWISEQLSRN